MELKDLIPTIFDKLEYKYRQQRHKEIDIIWKKFNKGDITREEYKEEFNKIEELYFNECMKQAHNQYQKRLVTGKVADRERKNYEYYRRLLWLLKTTEK